MADKRTASTILEDVSSQEGRALHAAVENDAAAGKNAHGVLAGKDGSGNLRYLKVNADGELIVSQENGDIARLSDAASVGGNASFVDVAVITLQTDKVYRNIGWLVGCFRDAEFKIVHNDDSTPVDLALGMLVSAGNTSDSGSLENLTFTSGSTGTQELKIQAKNMNALSDFRATLAVDEVQ